MITLVAFVILYLHSHWVVCFSQPKRYNLRLCYVWPVAAKLVDNKTLFCHSERSEESLSAVFGIFSGKALNNTSPLFSRQDNKFAVYVMLKRSEASCPKCQLWDFSPLLRSSSCFWDLSSFQSSRNIGYHQINLQFFWCLLINKIRFPYEWRSAFDDSKHS